MNRRHFLASALASLAAIPLVLRGRRPEPDRLVKLNMGALDFGIMRESEAKAMIAKAKPRSWWIQTTGPNPFSSGGYGCISWIRPLGGEFT